MPDPSPSVVVSVFSDVLDSIATIICYLTRMPGNLLIYPLLRSLHGIYLPFMVVKRYKVQVIDFVHAASLNLVRKELTENQNNH